MGKATIGDIARQAGLSTATVDRALNGRRGVSAANRNRVLRAARDLGYLPVDGMMPMPARPAHLAFLIPFPQNSFMRDVALSITDFAASLPLVASCDVITLDGLGPAALMRGIDALPPATGGVGLVITDRPETRAAIRRLSEAGIRVVTIASDVPATPRSAYVGVNNRAAGRAAGQLMGMMAGGTAGAVALFLGSRAFHGHCERERGFRAYLKEELPGLVIRRDVETGEDNRRSFTAMADLLRHIRDLVGVYCLGAGRAGIVEALQTARPPVRPHVVVHDLTDSSRGWLRDRLIDVVIDQNPRLVGEQAVTRLLGSIASTTPLLSYKDIEPRIILRETLPGPPPP